MATTKKRSSVPKTTPVTKKVPIAAVRAENEKLKAEVDKLKGSAYCRMCDCIKTKDKFYMSTDPKVKGGVTPICKRCALIIAERMDKNGEFHEPTKESVIEALRYLDKPFIESVWSSSIQESENVANGKARGTAWRAMVKNLAMQQYDGLTFKDSDMFKEHIVYDDEKTEQELVEEHNGQDTWDSFVKNKEDVIRLLDYDPFEREPVRDQPFLYSQLLGMLDASEDANEDMMRVSSAIQIVRAFLQSAKIDDTIAKLMSDVTKIQENSATIKSLQDSKQKLTSMITSYAAESCLSLKNSKKQVKGENTWTGKLKKLRDANLREAELNSFDIGTCEGMRQVAEISAEAIIKKLHCDESEYTDMIAEQRRMVSNALQKADAYAEAVRILLRENVDLRDALEKAGLLNKEKLTDLDELVNTYIEKQE